MSDSRITRVLKFFAHTLVQSLPLLLPEIDCTLKIRPHCPQTYISKWRHPRKNFVKNDILPFKFHECFVKIHFLYLLLLLR